jgi:phage-related protein
MAQVLGTAQVNITADTSALISQLSAATSMVTNSMTKLSGTVAASGGVMSQAIIQTMNSMARFGGNTQKATNLSKTLFNTIKLGAITAGAAMIATSEQGQRLMESMGQLSQVTIEKTIGPAIDHIAHAISSLATNIQNFGFGEGFERTFSQSTKVAIVAVAGAIMGAMIPALNALRINLLAQIPVWWSAIAPLLPFIAIGAAVAVLAYLIWQNWSTITGWLQTAWNALWTGAVTIFNGIVNAITTAWNWVVSTTTSIWNGIVAFFKEWGLTLLVIFGGPIGWILALIINNWNKIKAFTIQLWNSVKSFLSSVWNGIKALVEPIFNPITQFIQKAWNKVKSITSSLWSGIKSWLTSTWNSVKSTASSVWNSVTSAISKAWSSLKSKASSIWSGIYSTISSWINKALGAIRPFIRGFNSMVSKVNSLTGSKLPTISMPGLAKGGIVTAPTMAVVGEGRYHEAVLPLSNKTFNALAEGITARMSGSGGGSPIVVKQMIVREEADIDRIARKLNQLQVNQQRAGGVW